MPELAEVALYAHDLNKIIGVRKVTKISFPNQNDWGRIIVPRKVQLTLKYLVGHSVSFSSQGKALLLSDRRNRKPVAEIRLGMTGQFHLTKMPGKWKRHYFVCMHFGEASIHYADPRRFGRIMSPKCSSFHLAEFSESEGLISVENIALPSGFLKKPRISWLLDAGEKTGVGNYMANEALGRLALSPFSPCKSAKEAWRLLSMCRRIAFESFQYGGNSFGSGYYRLDGKEGRYLSKCRYYQNPKIPRSIFRGRPVYSKLERIPP